MLYCVYIGNSKVEEVARTIVNQFGPISFKQTIACNVNNSEIHLRLYRVMHVSTLFIQLKTAHIFIINLTEIFSLIFFFNNAN